MDSPEEIVNDENEINESEFYTTAANYWSKIPATIDGMLGGFGFISITDLKGSEHFMKQLFLIKDPPGHKRAVDCGAGIGRITKDLLINIFDEVDLVEQNQTFLEEAKSFIGPTDKPLHFFNVGLQKFLPDVATYDVVWCQWVLGHLPDDDLVDFFKACVAGLKPNGVLVVKENVTSTSKLEVDKEDSSVTRPLHLLRELFKRAGLHCIKEQKQKNFPRGLFAVHMFALRPVSSAISELPDAGST